MECRLIGPLNTHVDMVDAGVVVATHQSFITKDVVDSCLHQEREAKVPFDKQIENLVPAHGIECGGLVGKHHHAHAESVPEHLEFVHEMLSAASPPCTVPEH